MSPRECTCQKTDLAVTVSIDGDPGEPDSTVSITCVTCYGPVLVKRAAAVEAVDIPMRLTCETERLIHGTDRDLMVYKLRAEAER